MRYQKLKENLPSFAVLFWAVFFFVCLIALIKYFLITFAGLYEPIFQWVKLTISEQKVTNGIVFQFVIACKILSLLIASGFIFIISSAFSTIFSYIFYKFCSMDYKRVNHPLNYSLIKGMQWSIYRNFLILAPPLSVIMAGSVLFLASVILFNLLLKIAGISITFTAFIMSFISFSIMFLFIFSLLVSLWQLASTIFGTEIAVSEPKLENKIIERRSKNLMFSKIENLYLAIGYLAFLFSIVVQIDHALKTDLFINPDEQWLLNFTIILYLIAFGLLEYFKASGYIESLLEYNSRVSKSPIKPIKS